jgi:hypothetical protein
MKTITLKSTWTYRTAERTVEFPAGDHEVTNEIAAKAEADGVWQENADGTADSATAPRKTRAADKSEG